MARELKKIDHKIDFKLHAANDIANMYKLHFVGWDKDDNCFSFSMNFTLYQLNTLFRAQALVYTTIAVTDQQRNWYMSEDNFMDINPKKKIKYAYDKQEIQIKGNYTTIEGSTKLFKVKSLTPWNTLDFEMRSTMDDVLYDQEDGVINLNGDVFNGYNMPEWEAVGTITCDGDPEDHIVNGVCWMERAYFKVRRTKKSARVENMIRLNLSFDDENMKVSVKDIFNRSDFSEKTWADVLFEDGHSECIEMAPLFDNVVGSWTSEESEQVYPTKLRINIPEIGLDVITTPTIDDQEAYSKKRNDCRYFGSGTFKGMLGDKEETGICSYEISGYWDENTITKKIPEYVPELDEETEETEEI